MAINTNGTGGSNFEYRVQPKALKEQHPPTALPQEGIEDSASIEHARWEALDYRPHRLTTTSEVDSATIERQRWEAVDFTAHRKPMTDSDVDGATIEQQRWEAAMSTTGGVILLGGQPVSLESTMGIHLDGPDRMHEATAASDAHGIMSTQLEGLSGRKLSGLSPWGT